MIGCNKCLSFFCPPTTVYTNLITFTLCAFTSSFLFPIGPLPSFQHSFSHGNSFLPPPSPPHLSTWIFHQMYSLPFLYNHQSSITIFFPSSSLICFQISLFFYLHMSEDCPTSHFPAFLVFSVSLRKSPANISTLPIKHLPLTFRHRASSI